MRCEPEQRVCAAQRNGQPQAGGESPERSETNPSLSAICLEMRTVAAAFSPGLLVANCEWLGRSVMGGLASRCSHFTLLSADMFFKKAQF